MQKCRRNGSVVSAIALAVLASRARLASGDTFVWSGAGADGNWDTAANWQSGAVPHNNGTADLDFTGTIGLTSNADVPFNIDSLTFDASAGAFMVGGSQLTLGAGGINDSSAATETIGNAVVLGSAQSWTVASGGTLTVNGAVNGTGPLTLDGAGVITLANASDTYTGATTVSNGTLTFATGSGLTGGGAINVGTSGTLNINGNVSSGANAITVDGGAPSFATLNLNAVGSIVSGAQSFGNVGGGLLNQNGGTNVVNGTLSFGNTGSTQVQDNGSTVTETVAGSGSFLLSGGSTTVNGNLLLGTGGSGGYEQTGGTLTVNGNMTVGQSVTGSLSYNGSTQSTTLKGYGEIEQTGGSTTVTGTLTLAGAAESYYYLGVNPALTVSSGGTLTAQTEDIGVNGGVAVVYQGGGTNKVGLLDVGVSPAMNGSAYTLLGTAPTLIANTEIIGDAGTGSVAQIGGLNTVAGAVTLGAQNGSTGAYALIGGTLQATSILGGAGSSSMLLQAGTLEAAANSTAFLQGIGGVQIGINGATVNTNGYDITIAEPLGHYANGALPYTDGGLVKTGGGTLTLSGSNSYNGNTTVNAGTLSVTGTITPASAFVNAGAELSVSGNGSVIVTAGGVFNVSGGSASLSISGHGSVATLNENEPANLVGSYTYADGVFTDLGNVSVTLTDSGTLTLGYTQADFVSVAQSGSSAANYTDGLLLSDSTYTLSGAATGNGSVTVGEGLPGTFQQSGGTFNGSLTIGYSAPGLYTLSGGTATTTITYVGQQNGANGTLVQTGGQHAAQSLNLATSYAKPTDQETGTYDLQGGTLTAGTVTSVGDLPAGDYYPGTSIFNFDGGTLQAMANNPTFFYGLTTANVQSGGAIIDTNGHSVTIAQNLLHDTTAGGLTKVGGGVLTLTGSNTYTGGTTISGGTLLADNTSGSATGTGSVNVGNQATLGGSGFIAGDVTINSGGTLSPGNSPGQLTLGGSLTLGSGSTLSIELGGTTAGTGYDQVVVGGPLALGGNLTVSTVNGFALTLGETFTILDDTSSSLTTGIFSNVVGDLYTDPAGNIFLVNYTADADGDLLPNDVTLTAVSVPEPSGILVLAGAGAGLLCRRRSTRRSIV